jgi:hypothetical protein
MNVAFDVNYGSAGMPVKEYGDAVGAFNLIFLSNNYFDGSSPDSILIGGAAIPGFGLPAHAVSTFLYEMKFDVSGSVPLLGEPPALRVDNVFIPPAGTWTLTDGFGTYTPDFQGNSNSSDTDPDAPQLCFAMSDRYICGDSDCNDIVNISDAVYLISYIFGGGPAPCASCP